MVAEENSEQTDESPGPNNPGPVGGELLAESRRKRGISVHEIAKELHIDEPKVRALEENRFEALGAPVFAKGHMRKYAELVGVPVDDLLADYYKLNRSAGAPPVVGPRRQAQRAISIGPWVAGVAVILVLAAALWWFLLTPSAERLTVQPATLAPARSELPEEPAPVNEDPAPASEYDATALDDIATGEIEEVPSVASVDTPSDAGAEAVLQEPAATGGDAMAESRVQLSLTFTGECWTEVTDAAGHRLYFGLGTEGRTMTLDGAEPLGVLLGNSTNVSIKVNGLDYGIPAANRRGNTARLTIYGQ